MKKILILTIFALAFSVPAAFGQKRKPAAKPLKSGVYKTVSSGNDTINFVRLDPATKSAKVTGITKDYTKGVVYFVVDLKRGQRLIITPDSSEVGISTYTGFEPLDGTTSGPYELIAYLTTSYSISVKSPEPGKNYILTLQLKR